MTKYYVGTAVVRARVILFRKVFGAFFVSSDLRISPRTHDELNTLLAP